jgi:hypothetical protein
MVCHVLVRHHCGFLTFVSTSVYTRSLSFHSRHLYSLLPLPCLNTSRQWTAPFSHHVSDPPFCRLHPWTRELHLHRRPSPHVKCAGRVSSPLWRKGTPPKTSLRRDPSSASLPLTSSNSSHSRPARFSLLSSRPHSLISCCICILLDGFTFTLFVRFPLSCCINL